MRTATTKRTDVALAQCIEAFAALHETNTAATRAALEAARLRFCEAVRVEFAATADPREKGAA